MPETRYPPHSQYRNCRAGEKEQVSTLYRFQHITRTKKADDQEISKTAIDILISKYFAIPTESIAKYRGYGLSNKEIVLCLGLSTQSGKSVDELAASYKEHNKSWGEIANSLGVAADKTGEMISNAYTR